MKGKKEYTILLATDPSTLSSQVNGLIERGWEPQGGVAITEVHEGDAEEGQTQWAQAMVRDEADAPLGKEEQR